MQEGERGLGCSTQWPERQGQPALESSEKAPTPRIDIIFHLTPNPHFEPLVGKIV